MSEKRKHEERSSSSSGKWQVMNNTQQKESHSDVSYNRNGKSESVRSSVSHKTKKIDCSADITTDVSAQVESSESSPKEVSALFENQNCVLYGKEDSFLLFIRFNESITFKGKVEVMCLKGNVHVFGFVLNPSILHYVPLYSSDASSLIRFEARSDSNVTTAPNFENFLLKFGIDSNHKLKKLKNEYACIHCISTNNSALNFVEQFNQFQRIFETKCSYLPRTFQFEIIDRDSAFYLRLPSAHRAAIAKVKDCHQSNSKSIVVICGGKNVGKSTFARYLVNSFLTRYPSVAYMECDLGQTELTPSGCVALHLLRYPLLGPPFTHQHMQPYKSCFYGSLTAADNPTLYIDCVRFIYEAYSSIKDVNYPLVVNTMGWNKGLGLALLIDIVRMVGPTHIIQLNSDANGKNLPAMTIEFIRDTAGWSDQAAIMGVSKLGRLATKVNFLENEKTMKRFKCSEIAIINRVKLLDAVLQMNCHQAIDLG